MSSSLFNENMSTNEARMALFRAVEGKSEKDRQKIIEDYKKIHHIIFQKEMKLAEKGWLIN